MNGPDAPSVAGEWWSARRFGLALALLLVAWFPTVALGLGSWFYRDYGALAYPTVHYAREALWRGELPLWNPLSHCGVPFLAQWGTMALYPGALVYLVGPLPWALNVFCLLHLWLAGLGMYCLAQRWTRDGLAAFMAGLAFTFSGLTLSCLLWPNYVAALGWMPWLVLTADRLASAGNRGLVRAAAVAALQILTGAPEIIAFTWLIVAACAVSRVVAGRARAEPPRCWWLLVLMQPVLVLVLGLGLGAVQLLPFLDLLQHSQRLGGTDTAKWALPGWGWISLVAPLVHCYRTSQGVFFQQGQEFFSSVYVGTGVVVLAVLGIARARPGRVWLLAGLAGLGLWLAFGDDGGLLPWVRKVVPALAWMRYPVKFLLLPGFLLPLLLAFGLSGWLGERGPARNREERRLLLAGVLVAGAVGLATWDALRRPLLFDQGPAAVWNGLVRVLFLAALVSALVVSRRLKSGAGRGVVSMVVPLLLLADLATHVPVQNPTLPARLLAPGLARPAQAPRPGQGRVFITSTAEAALVNSRVASFESDYVGKRLALWSNLNLLAEIAKVNGAATLRLREQAQVEETLMKPGAAAHPGVEDLLGVGLRTSGTSIVDWVSRATALPLVSAGQEPVFVSGDEALRALAAEDFDGRHRVWLPAEAREAAEEIGAGHRIEPVPRISGWRFGAEEMEFAVEARGPAWVVIAQSYDHNWRAFVDGRRVRIWRANHALQALAVPAGHHAIRLVYAVKSLHAGALVSGLAVLVCCGLWRSWPRLGTGGNWPVLRRTALESV
jgi:hypothetical protein